MLAHDKHAIESIIDRCTAGGSDNPRGSCFDTKKAQHQFDRQFEGVELSEFERFELIAYFEKLAAAEELEYEDSL